MAATAAQMRGQIDQRTVFSDLIARTEQRHQRDQKDQGKVDGQPERDRAADLFRIAFEAFYDLRRGHDRGEREGDHPEERERVAEAVEAAGQCA